MWERQLTGIPKSRRKVISYPCRQQCLSWGRTIEGDKNGSIDKL